MGLNLMSQACIKPPRQGAHKDELLQGLIFIYLELFHIHSFHRWFFPLKFSKKTQLLLAIPILLFPLLLQSFYGEKTDICSMFAQKVVCFIFYWIMSRLYNVQKKMEKKWKKNAWGSYRPYKARVLCFIFFLIQWSNSVILQSNIFFHLSPWHPLIWEISLCFTVLYGHQSQNLIFPHWRHYTSYRHKL